jgi:ABC-type dipeptide/oligopeptide/nickel transport system permease component
VNATYVLRRLLLGFLSLTAAVSIVFMMVHLIPGDPVNALLGDLYNAQAAEQLSRQLGLDKPLWRQYIDFMSGIAQGDFGRSYHTRQPVFNEVVHNLRYTVELAIGGIIVTILLGIPAGIIAALKRGRLADMITMSISLLGASMPAFWLGILLIIGFSVKLPWFPLLGVADSNNPLEIIKYTTLPAISIGIRGAALMARVTRSSLLEVLGQDYVRTARAKGLREVVVTQRHALRNALLPVVTVIGVDLGRMLGGTAITEIVFGRPGIGTLLVNSVLNRDYPLVQGTFIVYLTIIIVINLMVDLLYSRLDPRVTYK